MAGLRKKYRIKRFSYLRATRLYGDLNTGVYNPHKKVDIKTHYICILRRGLRFYGATVSCTPGYGTTFDYCTLSLEKLVLLLKGRRPT